MKNKLKKILIGILIGIAALVVILVLGIRIYFRAPVSSYYKASKKAFVIPGLSEGYVAQGISFDESNGNFYLTGYLSDGSASPIYIVNKQSKKLVKTIKMAQPDGSVFAPHAGGLSVFNGNIYVAGGADSCLYVFDKTEVDNAKDKTSVSYNAAISLKNSAGDDGIGVAFTTIKDGLIYAGEFYRLPQYPTVESHKIVNGDEEHNALVVAYELTENSAVPVAAYSITDEIQGMCFNGDSIYLTRSWALADSKVYKYSADKITQTGTKTVMDKEVPLYFVGNSALEETYTIAPMAEEIEFVDGKFYINCESASSKYVFGKFTGGKWCYATDFSKM